MRDHGISQRRACRLVCVDPKTVRREHPPDLPEIRQEIKEVAGKRRRFGCRRIGVLLERKGMIMNQKTVPLLPGRRPCGEAAAGPQTRPGLTHADAHYKA